VNNALKGAYILVTRPEHQAGLLCQLIEEQGGIAVRFPTLQIVPIDDMAGIQSNNPTVVIDNLANLADYHWLIFTSANAVNFALKANGGKIEQLKAAQIAAIGSATAKALETAGLQVNMLPKSGFDSEALLAMPQMQEVNGQRILLIKGQGGREELANILRSRGADVGYWEVYKRIMPNIDATEVIGLLEHDKLTVNIATSCETLQNLLLMLGAAYKNRLAMIPLVVISERIRQLAVELGFTKVVVAECPSDQAILESAIAALK
jgi:uroporphyrinogen-III synthase